LVHAPAQTVETGLTVLQRQRRGQAVDARREFREIPIQLARREGPIQAVEQIREIPLSDRAQNIQSPSESQIVSCRQRGIAVTGDVQAQTAGRAVGQFGVEDRGALQRVESPVDPVGVEERVAAGGRVAIRLNPERAGQIGCAGDGEPVGCAVADLDFQRAVRILSEIAVDGQMVD